jgi:hypothetical protein
MTRLFALMFVLLLTGSCPSLAEDNTLKSQNYGVQQFAALSLTHSTLKPNNQQKNFTLTNWGDGGTTACGGYCNDIDPSRRGSCDSNHRAC